MPSIPENHDITIITDYIKEKFQEKFQNKIRIFLYPTYFTIQACKICIVLDFSKYPEIWYGQHLCVNLNEPNSLETLITTINNILNIYKSHEFPRWK